MLGLNTGLEGGVSFVHTKPEKGECPCRFVELAESEREVLHYDRFTTVAQWAFNP
jgi:hypothetical protein